MIGLLDNYDSFTYNVYQAVAELGHELLVVRNDEPLERLSCAALDALILSPGPGTPAESGITLDALRHFSGRLPILGICLGHQAIGECFGGQVIRAPQPVHGKTSAIHHNGRGLFYNLAQDFPAARYHSLLVDETTLPDCLEVSARNPEGLIMALRHRTLPIAGVQFHPESILTPDGKQLLNNFLQGHI